MDRLTFDLIKVIFFFKEHYFIRLKSKKTTTTKPKINIYSKYLHSNTVHNYPVLFPSQYIQFIVL